jgi:hypothetical protein
MEGEVDFVLPGVVPLGAIYRFCVLSLTGRRVPAVGLDELPFKFGWL